MTFIAKSHSPANLAFGVFNTKTGKFEINPKTNMVYSFTKKDRLDAIVKAYNDAEAAEIEAVNKPAPKAKVGRPRKVKDTNAQASA